MSTPMSTPATMSPSDAPSPSSIAHRVAVVAGFVLHAAVGVFVASSGLLMPAWAVVLMVLIWLLAMWFAIAQRRRPLAVLLTPFATFAIWYLTGWAGETFLGWTG